LAVLKVASQDPAVASATGYVGAGGVTVAGNNGRVFLTLKPQRQRRVTADQVIARLGKALQQVQGITLYMQAAQDINIGAMVSKTQYQYVLTDVDSQELNLYAPQLLQKLQALPQLTSVASDQQSAGRTMSIEIDRSAASRFRIDRPGWTHPLRRLRPASRGAHLHDAEPVLRHPRGRSRFQLGPNAL
jgi:HAE1 family hydrophobic/amphiphilic exporter-1